MHFFQLSCQFIQTEFTLYMESLFTDCSRGSTNLWKKKKMVDGSGSVVMMVVLMMIICIFCCWKDIRSFSTRETEEVSRYICILLHEWIQIASLLWKTASKHQTQQVRHTDFTMWIGYWHLLVADVTYFGWDSWMWNSCICRNSNKM